MRVRLGLHRQSEVPREGYDGVKGHTKEVERHESGVTQKSNNGRSHEIECKCVHKDM